jgi:hypothetical protein
MPWKILPSGAKMFVPKGKFEKFQAAQFWARFGGGISARVMDSFSESPKTVRIVKSPHPGTPPQADPPSHT